MNNNEIETGLLKEKIKQEIKCLKPDKYLERIKEHIENDNDIERLRKILDSLEYYQEKQKKEMNQREYWNKKKVEIEREAKELKKKGNNVEIELLEDFKKGCDKLGKIKPLLNESECSGVYKEIDKALNDIR